MLCAKTITSKCYFPVFLNLFFSFPSTWGRVWHRRRRESESEYSGSANAIHLAGTVISSIRLPGRCSRQNAGSGAAGKTLSTLFYSPLRKLILLIDCCPWLPTLSTCRGAGRGRATHRWAPGGEGGCSQSGCESNGVKWTFLVNFPSTKGQQLRFSHVVWRWSKIRWVSEKQK